VRDDLYVSKYIRHTGDTNTYLEFSDRNDRIALGTSGSSHLTITSAGFVGLGTTEPAEQFHIYKGPAAAGIPTIRLSNQIQAWNIATRSDMDNNLTIRDVTRGDNLVNILTGGNVGIGTDNPGSKLHVAGDSIRVDGGQGLEFGGTNEAIYGSSSNGFITWYTQGTEKMKLSGGRLGLGTSSPNGKLNVSNGTLSLTEAPNGNADELVIQDDAAAGLSILTPNNNSGYIIFGDTDDSSRGQFIYDHSSDSLKIHVNNAERAVINSSGSFGIGTTAPGYKLHVVESNTSTVAISAFGEIHAGGDIVSSSSSDRRQKTNIKNLDNALDKVLTLDGVEYDWNEMAAAHRVGKHDVGVIAQQVEEVLPDAIDYREDGMMAVRYERIIPLLIESIKELKSEIDELKGK
jgi:hypothetical protein